MPFLTFRDLWRLNGWSWVKSDGTISKERFKSYLFLFLFGVAIIVPEIMVGIPDKTIIFRKFDLWWPLLTSIFNWAKTWPKWLRTGSLRAVDRRIARRSSFLVFELEGGSFCPPPPTMAKVAETATGRGLKYSSHVHGPINVGEILYRFCSHLSNKLIVTPETWTEKFENFERINSIRETNENVYSWNSRKRLGTSRLCELHESKFPFVSHIEFIRSKLPHFSAHVTGVSDALCGSVTAAQRDNHISWRSAVRTAVWPSVRV